MLVEDSNTVVNKSQYIINNSSIVRGVEDVEGGNAPSEYYIHLETVSEGPTETGSGSVRLSATTSGSISKSGALIIVPEGDASEEVLIPTVWDAPPDRPIHQAQSEMRDEFELVIEVETDEIGKVIGRGRERVRQIEAGALRRLESAPDPRPDAHKMMKDFFLEYQIWLRIFSKVAAR